MDRGCDFTNVRIAAIDNAQRKPVRSEEQQDIVALLCRKVRFQRLLDMIDKGL